MVDVGKQLTESQGHADRTKYHVADCTKTLDHLQLGHQSYDLVMGNWLLRTKPSLKECGATLPSTSGLAAGLSA
jgi:hypothetical protein